MERDVASRLHRRVEMSTAGADFDLVVLGTGGGGSAPASKCRAAGWRVAVVDDQPYGGTCALRGCDPKKVLVAASDVVSWSNRMLGHGVTGEGEATIDWPALMRFKRTFTDPVPAAREQALTKQGIETLHGEASFLAEDRILVGARQLLARHFVIAAGSGPRRLNIPGEELVISSTGFLEMDSLPRRIAFIGAGYISLEFAHVAHRAGAEVVVIGRGAPLPHFDSSVVEKLIAHSREIGVDIRLDTSVTAVERAGASGKFLVRAKAGDRAYSIETDLVVHGAGRVPNTARLGAQAGNVRLERNGAIAVNEFLQSTTNPRVYAVGDIALPPGSLPLTPVAAHEGTIVASNLLNGNRKRPDYRGIPSVVFTQPPLASVGLTEKAAREQGINVRVKTGDTGGWYSSRIAREPVGMFKTIADADSDRIVGAHLLGRHAEEVINLLALAIRNDISATEMRQMVYAYPTSGSDLPYMV
ncbi:MAG: NAD(P)/FAD-dependent oxidoreductase [Gemmatimonadaceae bacterium]